ncbi:uncharacterized protein LOC132633693 [Lycium barbarum]|uniref:uncharacterized protein LOC132633693 n=1 Tax=Lycium barbarum TaxID=112863 RepID=UPI00293EC01F|nr:uncharacterized protein LOC132633693 [Lycium barbarum]
MHFTIKRWKNSGASSSNFNSSARQWNHAVMPLAAAHGRNFPPDSSFYCYDMNHHDMVAGNISTSLEMGNYHNDFNSNRSSFPQHLPGNLQSSRESEVATIKDLPLLFGLLQAICAMGMLILQMTHHSCLLKVTPQDIHGHCIL